MDPMQSVTFKTQKDCRFQATIVKLAKNIFELRWDLLDPNFFSGSGISNTTHNSADEAYKEMLKRVMGYLKQKSDGDSISDADNPSNDELLDKASQMRIAASDFNEHFPVKVNGKF